MAIDKVTSASITTDAVGPTQLNEASNYAFTGTVTGASAGSNTPAFFVTRSSAQVIADSTMTKIEFNSERYDTDNAYDNSSNYRFTVPSGKGGKYFFTYACGFGSFNANKHLYINLRINGTQQNYQFWSCAVNGDHSVNGSSILDLNAADYVEVFVYHNHGSGKSTDTTTGDKYGVVYFGGYKLA